MNVTGVVEAAGVRARSTVVCLVTDIEGSTTRWERWPEEMAAALRRHDSILRATIEAAGGWVFRTAGDAFCAAFDDVTAAVDAAVEIERALASEDFGSVRGLRVRIALDVGLAERREHEYVGIAIGRAALVCELACGGRILTSAAFARAAKGRLGPGRALVDRGSHALRGLDDTRERVFEVRAPGLPRIDVPLGARASELGGNVPQQLVRLIGRRTMMRDVAALLETRRVVELVGPGGVGKTQLAIAIGHASLRSFPDGVWFVDLGSIVDANFVSSQIAATLGIAEAPRIPIPDAVANWLRERSALIIIDTCERLGGAVAAAVLPIAFNCPGVRILTTSRERLPLAETAEVRVEPLALPPATVTSRDEALAYDAVALFCERAAALDTRFTLRDDEVPAVIEICRALDGLPLAIELAASKVTVLRPADLARRLEHRFRLLVGGQRRDRHRHTLRAVIAWSYDQLGERQRRLFRMLAVFGGPWTLEGAAAICEGEVDARDRHAVEADLASLIDESLVTIDDAAFGATRFRFYESARVYALERLAESGDLPLAKRRLVANVRAFAIAAERAARESSETSLLEEVEREIGSIRLVLTWTLVERADIAEGAAIAAALGFYWLARRHREGASWLDLAHSAAPQLDPRLAAEVLRERARVEHFTRPKVELAFEAVAAQRASGDLVGQKNALENLVLTLMNVRRYGEVAPFMDEWERTVERSGDRTTACRILAYRGFTAIEIDGPDTARGYFERAREMALALGLPRDHGRALRGLADVALEAGDPAAARDLALEALAVYEPLGERRFQSWVRITLAHACAANRAFDEAWQNVRESIRVYRDTDFTLLLFETFALAAALEAAESNDEAAGLLIGYIDSRRSSLPFPWSRRTDGLIENVLGLLERRLGAAARDELLARGRRLDEEACANAILPNRETLEGRPA